MFGFDEDHVMDPGEEYLTFRIWEEICLVDEEEEEERPGRRGRGVNRG